MNDTIQPLEIEVALPAKAPLDAPDTTVAIWIQARISEVCRQLGMEISNIKVAVLTKTGSWCRIRIEHLSEESSGRIGEILLQRGIKYPIVDNLADTADWEG